MIPEACASMRSMARWVLPVLVGPRTAFTRYPSIGEAGDEAATPAMREWLGLGRVKASGKGGLLRGCPRLAARLPPACCAFALNSSAARYISATPRPPICDI